jgi:hypothetical protein
MGRVLCITEYVKIVFNGVAESYRGQSRSGRILATARSFDMAVAFHLLTAADTRPGSCRYAGP